MLKVALIIPCYNEQDSISRVLEEINSLPPNALYSLTPVVINDCSTDSTAAILQRSACVYLDLPVNLGIGGAVQTGFLYAFANNYDVAVQLDGDGQHPPEELKHLLDPIITSQADVVIGSRFITKEG